jgi:DNA repair protein RecO (recombination protein O)
MKSIKTTGIVLKQTNFGEADRLLTIFSYDQGKVRALAKGARKTLSKLGGHLEPGSMTAFQLSEGRSFYVVTGADLQYAYADIRTELRKTSIAYYLFESVDALTVEQQAHPHIFSLLSDGLVLLETVEPGPTEAMLPPAFTLKLLAGLGYLPELGVCVNCQQPLEPEGNMFSPRLGGILCVNCQQLDYGAIVLSATTIKVMRLILDNKLEFILRLNPEATVIRELTQIIEIYLQQHSDREMKSLRFVKEVIDSYLQ